MTGAVPAPAASGARVPPRSLTTCIADILRTEAVSGKYAGGRFPSDKQVMIRFGVARQTAVKAIETLVRERIVTRRRGSGTFVARNLRKATGALGVIVPGLAYAEIFAPICGAVSRICAARGYSLQLAEFSGDDPAELAKTAVRVTDEFIARGVDGVVFYPVELLPNSVEINSGIAARLKAANIPVVLLDGDICRHPDRCDCDIVMTDNFLGGYAIGRHLVRQGVRRITFQMRNHWANSVRERLYGVAAACVDAGLAWSERNVFRAEPDDLRRVAALMKGRGRPQAVVCGNDTAAMKLVNSLHRLGYAVPDDVLVAGYDDVQNARFATPPITTVRQPLNAIAEELVRMLFARRENPDAVPRTVTLHSVFVPRESTDAKRLRRAK